MAKRNDLFAKGNGPNEKRNDLFAKGNGPNTKNHFVFTPIIPPSTPPIKPIPIMMAEPRLSAKFVFIALEIM